MKINVMHLEWFCPLKIMALLQQRVSSHTQMSCVRDIRSKLVFSFSTPQIHLCLPWLLLLPLSFSIGVKTCFDPSSFFGLLVVLYMWAQAFIPVSVLVA